MSSATRNLPSSINYLRPIISKENLDRIDQLLARPERKYPESFRLYNVKVSTLVDPDETDGKWKTVKTVIEACLDCILVVKRSDEYKAIAAVFLEEKQTKYIGDLLAKVGLGRRTSSLFEAEGQAPCVPRTNGRSPQWDMVNGLGCRLGRRDLFIVLSEVSIGRMVDVKRIAPVIFSKYRLLAPKEAARLNSINNVVSKLDTLNFDCVLMSSVPYAFPFLAAEYDDERHYDETKKDYPKTLMKDVLRELVCMETGLDFLRVRHRRRPRWDLVAVLPVILLRDKILSSWFMNYLQQRLDSDIDNDELHLSLDKWLATIGRELWWKDLEAEDPDVYALTASNPQEKGLFGAREDDIAPLRQRSGQETYRVSGGGSDHGLLTWTWQITVKDHNVPNREMKITGRLSVTPQGCCELAQPEPLSVSFFNHVAPLPDDAIARWLYTRMSIKVSEQHRGAEKQFILWRLKHADDEETKTEILFQAVRGAAKASIRFSEDAGSNIAAHPLKHVDSALKKLGVLLNSSDISQRENATLTKAVRKKLENAVRNGDFKIHSHF